MNEKDPSLRAELIGGRLVPKAEADAEHARAQSVIGAFIGMAFDLGGSGEWWILTNAQVCFPPADVYMPDLAGWRRSRLPDPSAASPIEVIPDWCCEVVSPRSGAHDRVHKRRVYAAHSVRHYWLADPAARVLEALELGGRGWRECGAWDAGEVRIPPFEALELDVSRLFLPRY